MKRALFIAMIATALTLFLGWLTFDRLTEEETPEARGSLTTRHDSEGEPTALDSPTPTTATSTESPSDQPSELERPHLSDRFDWRRPRAETTRSRIESTPDESRQAPRVASRREQRGGVEKEKPVRRTTSTATTTDDAESPSSSQPEPSARATSSEEDPASPKTPRDPSEDSDPPVLEWIRFTPAEISAGSETILSASAIDDLAGVRDFVGRVSSPSGNAHVGFSLPRNEATATWETALRIPEKAEAGRWQITWLRITDEANNTRDLRWAASSGPPGSSLIVTSVEGDGDPPVLQSVYMNTATVGPEEPARITVQVTDEPSGVRFVSGTFQSPSGKAWAPFTASGQGDLWTGSVTVPEDGECGEWTLRRVTAIDNANNQATWGKGDERIAGVSFYRSCSGPCDSEAPVVTRIELTPRVVSNENESTIRLSVFIDDVGSGVANASGFVIATEAINASPQRVHFVLQKPEGSAEPWTGTISIPRHSMTGRWTVRALRVTDQARNQRTYGGADPVMANAWFVVE